MKKDAMISIKGIYDIDGERDVIELLTCGRFYRKDNSYWLSYNESETTGFAGHRTTLRVEPDKVTMRRTGASQSNLVVQKGCRHQCSYETGYGAIMVGISGEHIANDLTDSGGTVDFSYSMDINTVLTSENRVIIKVSPQEEMSGGSHDEDACKNEKVQESVNLC